MSRLLLLVVVNLVLACLLSVHAFAGNVTVLVGGSQFQAQGDGIWYQAPFEHTLNLRSASWGVRYDGVGYSFGYMNLGRVSSSALATAKDSLTPGDGGYSSTLGRCDPSCARGMSHWNGSGDVQGIYASVVKHWGPWALEGGAYLYRPTWTVNIPDWIGCDRCEPTNLTVTHNPRLQLGPMVGVRYALDKWSLNLSWWRTVVSGDEWIPVYSANTVNFALGYTF